MMGGRSIRQLLRKSLPLFVLAQHPNTGLDVVADPEQQQRYKELVSLLRQWMQERDNPSSYDCDRRSSMGTTISVFDELMESLAQEMEAGYQAEAESSSLDEDWASVEADGL
jgi:hypothetical protein